MPKEVLINCGAGEIRVALVDDGRLQDGVHVAILGYLRMPCRNTSRAGGRTPARHYANYLKTGEMRAVVGLRSAWRLAYLR